MLNQRIFRIAALGLVFLFAMSCSSTTDAPQEDVPGSQSDTNNADSTEPSDDQVDQDAGGEVLGPATSSETLRALLESAQSGDVIEVSSGDYEGSFTVSAGVHVKGQGDVHVTASEGAAFILLADGAAATALEDIHVTGDRGAVVAYGDGSVVFRNVVVNAETGFALALEGVNATLENVSLHGAIDSLDDNILNGIGAEIDSRDVAIMGLLAADTVLTVSDLQVEGFAGFGVALVNSSVDWDGGFVQYCVGASVFAQATALNMNNVLIADGTAGRSLSAVNAMSFGVALVADSHMTSSNLQVERMKGVGILSDESTSSHENLAVIENRLNGIWVQNSGTNSFPAFEMNSGTLDANGSAAIVIRDSMGVSLGSSEVNTTVLRTVMNGLESERHGDGIQFVGLQGSVVVENVGLVGNERVGLLLDGGTSKAGPANYSFSGVSIDAGNVEVACGLMTQNGAPARDTLTGVAVDDVLEALDQMAIEAGTTFDVIPENDATPSAGIIGSNGLIGTNGIVGTNGIIGTNGLSVANGVLVNN